MDEDNWVYGRRRCAYWIWCYREQKSATLEDGEYRKAENCIYMRRPAVNENVRNSHKPQGVLSLE